MVLEPRVTLQRKTPSEQQALALSRELHGTTKQRVLCRSKPQRRRIHHAGPRRQPKTTTLESIGRKPHTTGTHEKRRPVHPDPIDIRLRGRTSKTPHPPLATP